MREFATNKITSKEENERVQLINYSVRIIMEKRKIDRSNYNSTGEQHSFNSYTQRERERTLLYDECTLT